MHDGALSCYHNYNNSTLVAAIMSSQIFLLQLQLYARNRGKVNIFDVGQRGYVFEVTDDPSDSEQTLLPILTVIHILMNVAIALVIMRLVTAYYSSLSVSKTQLNSPVVSIYWSNVFIAILADVMIILGNVGLYAGIGLIGENSSSALAYRIINDITMASLIALELVVAIITPKNHKLFIPHVITHGFCCCQCAKCCGWKPGRIFLRKVIQTVAIWALMVFLQIIASSILPVVIVCLRNPVPSFAFVTLLAACLFCLVIFIAHFIHISGRLRVMDARKKFSAILQAFVFLVFLGIVALAVIVYLSFVRAGSDTNSISGLIFSLIPSAVLAIGAWVAKSKLLRDDEDENEDQKGDQAEKGPLSVLTKYGGSFRKKVLLKGKGKKGDMEHMLHLESSSLPNEEMESEPVDQREKREDTLSRKSSDDVHVSINFVENPSRSADSLGKTESECVGYINPLAQTIDSAKETAKKTDGNSANTTTNGTTFLEMEGTDSAKVTARKTDGSSTTTTTNGTGILEMEGMDSSKVTAEKTDSSAATATNGIVTLKNEC